MKSIDIIGLGAAARSIHMPAYARLSGKVRVVAGCDPDPKARDRLISRFTMDQTKPEWALAFEWDIVLRGRDQTPFETQDDGDVA